MKFVICFGINFVILTAVDVLIFHDRSDKSEIIRVIIAVGVALHYSLREEKL